MKTEIKILHASCCATKSPIKSDIQKIADKNNIEVTIEEYTELKDTMGYGTVTFPSIVVNGKVFDYKKHNTEDTLLPLL